MNTQEQSAFFSTRSEAESAAQALRQNGVPSDAIDIHDSSDARTGSGVARNESFWDRVKDFFSGESSSASSGYRDAYGNGAILTVSGDYPNSYGVLQQYGGRASGGSTSKYDTDTTDTGRMQLREERLDVSKHRVEQGEVRLGKDVVTEHQEVEVPVTREEVYIERRPVAEGEFQSETGDIGEGGEVRVPVMRDEVSVEKRQVVAEEVGIGKRQVQETQVVGADVRRERARLEKSGDVESSVRGDI